MIYESQAEQPPDARQEKGCFAPPVCTTNFVSRAKAELIEEFRTRSVLSSQPLRSRREIKMDKFNLDEDEDEFDFDEEIAQLLGNTSWSVTPGGR